MAITKVLRYISIFDCNLWNANNIFSLFLQAKAKTFLIKKNS